MARYMRWHGGDGWGGGGGGYEDGGNISETGWHGCEDTRWQHPDGRQACLTSASLEGDVGGAYLEGKFTMGRQSMMDPVCLLSMMGFRISYTCCIPAFGL